LRSQHGAQASPQHRRFVGDEQPDRGHGATLTWAGQSSSTTTAGSSLACGTGTGSGNGGGVPP
jgi:hypothetical protein